MPFLSLAVLLFLPPHNGNMVHLHGTANIRTVARVVQRTSMHEATHRPPDPQTLLSAGELGEKVGDLVEWMTGKRNILTLTGAGLSTESGIPDYRGNQGAYHNGHKPMIHDEFMRSSASRQRYWGRAMVGWRDFDLSQPNVSMYTWIYLLHRFL
jgi:NAD+-dependent protein deacetylase sirtuin 4